MNQSDNARPCNCEQANELKGMLERACAQADDALKTGEQLAEVGNKMLSTIEALNLTCAAQGRKLAAIEKILLGAVPRGAAHLRDVRFVSPELEAIRLAMLERPW